MCCRETAGFQIGDIDFPVTILDQFRVIPVNATRMNVTRASVREENGSE